MNFKIGNLYLIYNLALEIRVVCCCNDVEFFDSNGFYYLSKYLLTSGHGHKLIDSNLRMWFFHKTKID